MKRAWIVPAVSLLLLAAVQTPVFAAGGANYNIFPRSDEIFRRLLGDPRQAQTTVRYYRSRGQNAGDVALGNTWGLLRWGDSAARIYQLSAEGMAYSRFLLAGGINEFEAIDFFLNVPLEVRRGKLSGRATLFHESSHLGDDHFRRTGSRGARFSIEGLRGIVAYEPFEHVRVYGGGTILLHEIPRGQHGVLQSGFELRSRNLRRVWSWIPEHECWMYLAQDFQWKGRTAWNLNSHTMLGLRIGASRVVRAMRVHIGYFEGHSEFGQFFSDREQFFDLGMTFDF